MLSFSTLIVYEQSKLIIHEQGGATQSFLLSDIKKLTFSDDYMCLERKNVTVSNSEISDDRHLV